MARRRIRKSAAVAPPTPNTIPTKWATTSEVCKVKIIAFVSSASSVWFLQFAIRSNRAPIDDDRCHITVLRGRGVLAVSPSRRHSCLLIPVQNREPVFEIPPARSALAVRAGSLRGSDTITPIEFAPQGDRQG